MSIKSPLNEISIVILNYKTYQETIRLVEQLQKQKNVNLKIVVVDNCSPNDSFDILGKSLRVFKNVTLLKSAKNGGYAFGNNVGLKYLVKFQPSYVAIMNNDIYLDDEYILSKMIDIYPNLKNACLVAPKQFNVSGEIIPSPQSISISKDFFNCFYLYRAISTYLLRRRKFQISTPYEKVHIVPGAFFLVKFDIFKDMGFFDENTFLYGEERILAFKAQKASRINYRLNELDFRHVHSRTISSELDYRKRYSNIYKSLIYYSKYYRKCGFPIIGLLRIGQLWSFAELFVVNKIKELFR